MKKIFYGTLLFSGLFFSGALLLTSCSKDNNTDTTTMDASAAKAYFETNMANQNLMVTSAKDSGADVTSTFSGYTLYLTDSATVSGTATATTELKNVAGFWNIDADYAKITFSFPVLTLPRLTFLNRQWTISSRATTSTTLVPTDGYNASLTLSKK